MVDSSTFTAPVTVFGVPETMCSTAGGGVLRGEDTHTCALGVFIVIMREQ